MHWKWRICFEKLIERIGRYTINQNGWKTEKQCQAINSPDHLTPKMATIPIPDIHSPARIQQDLPPPHQNPPH